VQGSGCWRNVLLVLVLEPLCRSINILPETQHDQQDALSGREIALKMETVVAEPQVMDMVD
jgi:hypothetical protein